MPRSIANSIENNFVRGLLTEASGLNFPENGCTDTDNCNFELTGEVRRREGFDFEQSYATKTINRASSAISTYLWKNVGGDGNVALWVMQVGETLYFYDALQSSTLSTGALSTTVNLATYKPSGAPSPATVECSFSDGSGYLFVTHPTLEPFYVSFDDTTDTATATQITIEMRDFLGIDDSLTTTERLTTLSDNHNYNLLNQGWKQSSYAVETSTSSITPGTGSKVFTVAASGPWAANDPIYIWSKSSLQTGEGSSSTSSNLHFMQGIVASYSGTTLTVTVSSYGPTSPTARTDWQIASGPDYIQQWNDTMGTYPSNADIWWNFKDSDELFNPAKTAVHVARETAAPKGHHILNAFNQDRATVSGIAGLTAVTSSYYRPTTSCFFASRVFYAGVTYRDFTSTIYFTQILKQGSVDGFGLCYQANDPTSEELFDLLPNDGGVIVIPEAGTILKLWSMQGGLVVFATNGIWFITGSTGIGFAADDYTVRKISSIRAISATSFVDIGGFPAWWSLEGIYILQPDGGGTSLSVKSLTDETILTYYSDIPASCKRQARGYFNLITKKIHWLFRSTEAGTVDEIYEYDKILIWNARTAAFNPWSIAASTVKMHGVIVIDNAAGNLVENTVVDNSAVTVVNDAASTVVSYSIGASGVSPEFKYLVSYDNGAGSYAFTFVEEKNTSYLDFYTYDSTGVDYTSYFISGYKVHGQAQRKFQSNYVYIFSKEIPSQYNFQAIWDYANTGDSGSWSSQTHQSVVVTNTQYNVKRNRLKIRGEGLSVQFKVYSETGQPFNIIGWSTFESGNASI